MPTPKRNEIGLKALTKFLQKERTIIDIQEKFEISQRSAYRWLGYIDIKVYTRRFKKRSFFKIFKEEL